MKKAVGEMGTRYQNRMIWNDRRGQNGGISSIVSHFARQATSNSEIRRQRGRGLQCECLEMGEGLVSV